MRSAFNAQAMGKLYNKIDKEVLKKKLQEEAVPRTTLSFYKYAHIGNTAIFRDHFYLLLDRVQVFGRIYVSNEGINGQISVPTNLMDQFRNAMNEIVFLENVRLNIAIDDDGKSFYKLKVKTREKIVADGLDDKSFDVTDRGKHLSAKAFNELAQKDDTIIVDMRNHYESEVGHFEKAITPDVATFRDALPLVKEILEEQKDKDIIMYCTGGIRCEKASAYLKHQGFEKVYQLDGGIIEYTRQVNEQELENKFKGKNFVFDERLGERISEEIISSCHQCGQACDDHTNCANDACHILFIQCDSCKTKYDACCSTKCTDFNLLPKDQQEELRKTTEFNGSKFGKGRYKAHRKDHSLEDPLDKI